MPILTHSIMSFVIWTCHIYSTINACSKYITTLIAPQLSFYACMPKYSYTRFAASLLFFPIDIMLNILRHKMSHFILVYINVLGYCFIEFTSSYDKVVLFFVLCVLKCLILLLCLKFFQGKFNAVR